MTATDIEEETEVILDFDFDLEVPCYGFEVCGNKAEWVGTYSVCRHFHLWCRVHKIDAQTRLKLARISASRYVHMCCGTDNQPNGIIWTPL